MKSISSALAHAVIDRIAETWPPDAWRDVTVVGAISGGADSMALLRALHALKQAAGGRGRLVAAHYNHRLRGAESDADQAFVQSACEKLDTPCESNAAGEPTQSAARGQSDLPGDAASDVADAREDSTRRARYAFLRQVVMSCGARYLATAHTADDQAETVLHRVLRGTGIEGLAGILPLREFVHGVTLIRPMLAVRRSEVLAYLHGLNQPFRDDSTNASRDYTRNRLRHDLLPQLERDYNPRVSEALIRLARLAREAAEVIEPRVREVHGQALVRVAPNEIILDCRPLSAANPYLVRRVLMFVWEQQGWPLRDMSLEKWSQIAGLIADGGRGAERISVPGGVTVQRQEGHLVIRR